MKVSCANFDRTGDIMIIPVFKDLDKAPNNTTVGLGRGPSIAVKAAAASDAISGKAGESLNVWTKGCTVIFIGVGRKKTSLTKLPEILVRSALQVYLRTLAMTS